MHASWSTDSPSTYAPVAPISSCTSTRRIVGAACARRTSTADARQTCHCATPICCDSGLIACGELQTAPSLFVIRVISTSRRRQDDAHSHIFCCAPMACHQASQERGPQSSQRRLFRRATFSRGTLLPAYMLHPSFDVVSHGSDAFALLGLASPRIDATAHCILRQEADQCL